VFPYPRRRLSAHVSKTKRDQFLRRKVDEVKKEGALLPLGPLHGIVYSSDWVIPLEKETGEGYICPM